MSFSVSMPQLPRSMSSSVSRSCARAGVRADEAHPVRVSVGVRHHVERERRVDRHREGLDVPFAGVADARQLKVEVEGVRRAVDLHHQRHRHVEVAVHRHNGRVRQLDLDPHVRQLIGVVEAPGPALVRGVWNGDLTRDDRRERRRDRLETFGRNVHHRGVLDHSARRVRRRDGDAEQRGEQGEGEHARSMARCDHDIRESASLSRTSRQLSKARCCDDSGISV